VPQSYALGVEAQVDWHQTWADLGEERVKLQVFSMRSMASGGAYHRAYFRSTPLAAKVGLTTNLTFSEWTQVIPNARLCKASIDRITDRAHIVETGDGVVSLPEDDREEKEGIGGIPPKLRASWASLQPAVNSLSNQCRKSMTLRGAKLKFRKGPKYLAKSSPIAQYGEAHPNLSRSRFDIGKN
jgi:hypothetical protein